MSLVIDDSFQEVVGFLGLLNVDDHVSFASMVGMLIAL